MDDLKFIQSELSKIAISDLPNVAKRCGVSFGALFKIKYGTTKNPGYKTVKSIAASLRGKVVEKAA